MHRLVVSAAVLASVTLAGAHTARAQQPKPGDAIALPSVGEALALAGARSWPQKLEWLYDVPSPTDAAGKIVLHWFCAPKVAACTEDLARVVTLKENTRLYVVAYVNGTKAEAKKLDPIRETEGVGRGTVAFGKQVTALMKRMSISGPVSIVVGIDGKIAFVTTGASPVDLDARDAKVTALSGGIRDYASTSDGPRIVKPDDKFRLTMTVQLAPWLKYSKRTGAEFRLTSPPADIKCDNTVLRGDQLKIAEQAMTAQISCSGPKGVYELRGTITFGYDNPTGGGGGVGTESAPWKFEIKPMGMQ
ncbi:MAG TPA: hypothetical protein VN253_18140 [Kofleriaceae bacterium]|nr:hypothetical protein [Kofleriaceae bacterium]